ncbi:potassium channel family protein [Erythrobacter crassostreae]|uniref:TrkA family potassium uptake protein n=1 Tax=Erythrobacter crassostreae TaxID=2828328 RepID=A0A9X1F347_9SPHN|nr:TrkA family potassium uptake protein [Erythrobacter crassostrea]MBV7259289.1 TrkA family potassium uptake protein [Erythrobacter crassostrea]
MSVDSKKPILVIGLGRFGQSVARSLDRMGHEVLGVDSNAECVQLMAETLTQCLEADATDKGVLERLGVGDFEAAVVGIGTDIEASVLTTLALADLGVPQIWAKAVNENHGRILERIGATSVVFPEARMGERVAHILSGKMIDYIEFDDDFAIAKMVAPKDAVGQTLGQSRIRSMTGITVVGVKRPTKDFEYAQEHTQVELGDLLIVSGTRENVEKFVAGESN